MPVTHQPFATVLSQIVGRRPSKAAPSASTACASTHGRMAQDIGQRIRKNSWLAELENISLVTAYHSFAGEVEASNTPTIRRLTLHAVTNFRP
jgi:hypothetical protein